MDGLCVLTLVECVAWYLWNALKAEVASSPDLRLQGIRDVRALDTRLLHGHKCEEDFSMIFPSCMTIKIFQDIIPKLVVVNAIIR